jgi:hypothetical protein
MGLRVASTIKIDQRCLLLSIVQNLTLKEIRPNMPKRGDTNLSIENPKVKTKL